MNNVVSMNIKISKDIKNNAKIAALKIGTTLKEFVAIAIKEKVDAVDAKDS